MPVVVVINCHYFPKIHSIFSNIFFLYDRSGRVFALVPHKSHRSASHLCYKYCTVSCIVLCYALYCAMHCTVPCVVLCHTLYLPCTVLCHVLYCATHYTVMHCTVPRIVLCHTLYCAMHCTVMICTVPCIVLCHADQFLTYLPKYFLSNLFTNVALPHFVFLPGNVETRILGRFTRLKAVKIIRITGNRNNCVFHYTTCLIWTAALLLMAVAS
jgi:hypothetical protein